MKNYYSDLGLDTFEDNQEKIKDTYKTRTEELVEKYPSLKKPQEAFIKINEAFLVLSDVQIKKQYDYVLSTDIEDIDLLNQLTDKHNKAEQFVNDKINAFPKIKKKRKWLYYLGWGFGIFFVLLFISIIITSITKSQNEDRSIPISSQNIPNDWKNYSFDNFSVSMPPYLLYNGEADNTALNFHEYNGGSYAFVEVISDNKDNEEYGLISMIIYQNGISSSDQISYNQSPPITYNDKRLIKESLNSTFGEFGGTTSCDIIRWVKMNGINALEIPFTYSSLGSTMHGVAYSICNKDELVMIMTMSFDESASVVKNLSEKILSSFKWKHLK